MSDEINVIQRTQIIFCEPSSGSVAVVNAGPQGPAGGAGSGAELPPGGTTGQMLAKDSAADFDAEWIDPPTGGNTNPIDFLGANTSEARFRLDEVTNIQADIRLRADDGDGDEAMAVMAARKFAATPEFDGGLWGLYNGEGLTGMFAHAFPAEVQLSIGTAIGQTTSGFQIVANDGTSVLVAVTATGAIELLEQSDPAAPASNKARLFIRDDGSGNTQLCVRFATGAVQVIADVGLPPVRKYAAAIGGTSSPETVTHNLNTRDVQVKVINGVSPYTAVDVDFEATTLNTVTLSYSPSLGSGYRVVILG